MPRRHSRSQVRTDWARSQRIYQDAQDLTDFSEYESEDYEFGEFIESVMKAQMRRENEGDYPPEGHTYPKRRW
ncbi:hypothetical protein [Streptomyces sp. NPDC016845]|uniref:hypothetical protein n=1 Tax=Streptomyces sp. NPDC016845 TaxID=3364972 RepID=UPI0037A5DA7D